MCMPAHRPPLNLEDVPPHLKLCKAAGYRFQSENLVEPLVTLQATPFQMEQIPFVQTYKSSIADSFLGSAMMDCRDDGTKLSKMHHTNNVVRLV